MLHIKEVAIDGAKCLVLADDLDNEHSPYFPDTPTSREYLQSILNSIPQDCCG